MPITEILKIRTESLIKQIDTVSEFLATPKGVFETLDKAVKQFRQANIETLEALGLRIF